VVERVNPFTQGSWLWRAWRGRSVTFAALFALGLLGVSVLGWFRELLERLNAPWYVWFVAPIVLLSFLARKETEWIPDERQRRWWARGLVIGAIVVVILLAKLAPEKPASPPTREPQGRARVPDR
jgi:hypothetical protein